MLRWSEVFTLFAIIVVTALIVWPRGNAALPARTPAPQALPRCAATEFARHTDSTAYIVMRANAAPCRVTLPMDASAARDGTTFATPRTP